MEKTRLHQLMDIQDKAIKHAVEEMEAASALTLDTKTGRGDRAWLTGMCAKSIGVAVRIEQFLLLRERASNGFDQRDDEEQERAEAEAVRRAEAQMKAIIERAKPNFKHAKG